MIKLLLTALLSICSFSNAMQQNDCPICLEPLASSPVLQLPCHHVTHTACLEQQMAMPDQSIELQEIPIDNPWPDEDDTFAVPVITMNVKNCSLCCFYIGTGTHLKNYIQLTDALKHKQIYPALQAASWLSHHKFSDNALDKCTKKSQFLLRTMALTTQERENFIQKRIEDTALFQNHVAYGLNKCIRKDYYIHYDRDTENRRQKIYYIKNLLNKTVFKDDAIIQSTLNKLLKKSPRITF